MFIEVTEYLRCPVAHDPEWLVLAPTVMAGRHVTTGTLGCPICHAEYPIRDGVVRFGVPPAVTAGDRPLPAPDVVQALVGLESPGGYVVLAGSAARLAAGLGALLHGVHLVVVNAEGGTGTDVTRLESAAGFPLRDRCMRGVVLGGEVADQLAEAHRVVLPGQRVVVLAETASGADGLEPLARGQGLWVARRR